MKKLIAQNLHLFNVKSREKGLLLYYLSEVNFRLNEFKPSLQYIQEALKNPTSNTFQLRNWKIQEFKVKVYINPTDQTLDKMSVAIRQEMQEQIARLRPDERFNVLNQQEEFLNIEKILVRKRKKYVDRAFYQIINEKDEELLRKIDKFNNDKSWEKSKVSLARYQIEQKSQLLSDLSVRESSHRLSRDDKDTYNLNQIKQKQKISPINPEQEYAKLCKEKGVAERPEVIKSISSSLSFNPFEEMLNLSFDELAILLQVAKVTNLDLRNHKINDVLLQIIFNSLSLFTVTKFKINGASLISH